MISLGLKANLCLVLGIGLEARPVLGLATRRLGLVLFTQGLGLDLETLALLRHM